MTPELLERYGGPVPRYTSYPTAPHFSAAVAAEAYRDWLSSAGQDEPLSLYIHIPFCDTLCWFCGCHTKVVNRYAPVAAYLEALKCEIDLVADAIGSPAPVSRLHFGGGSPTILSDDDFAAVAARMRARFPFMAEAELGVEIDPRGMTEAAIGALGAAGVTRVSLGVQDLDDAVQRAVNRIQPLDETTRVVEWCRKAGIEGLNIDLMYGLPHQTADGVARTAESIVALRPDRIALFGYAHVPWMKKHQQLIDEAALPDTWERFEQAEAAAETFKAAGYQPIGLDHFAREHDALALAHAGGRLHRNFQGYTDDQARLLIGFGASAIGDLGDGYVQNEASINGYAKLVKAGRLATVRGVGLNSEDRLRRAIIERLMCDLSVDLAAVARPFGHDAAMFEADRASLHALEADGLVEIAGDRVEVTEAGRPLVRVVAAAFDAYLERSEGRHSSAV